MSYQATAWAYELPLKGPAKPVLVALADFADEAGSCYPGQERLCAMTGLSIRTLRRALDRLEDLGLLLRERRFDTYGHRTSDRYYLQIEVQSLPATVTSGQSDLRSESPSLPVTVSIPTGQSDRVTVSRTTSYPSGGREDAPAPTPRPDPWCKRHTKTEGHDEPCTACGRAREAAAAWDAQPIAASRDGQWAPTPIKGHNRKPAWDPDTHCEHAQLLGQCDACDQEARKAAEVLAEQFGANA